MSTLLAFKMLTWQRCVTKLILPILKRKATEVIDIDIFIPLDQPCSSAGTVPKRVSAPIASSSSGGSSAGTVAKLVSAPAAASCGGSAVGPGVGPAISTPRLTVAAPKDIPTVSAKRHHPRGNQAKANCSKESAEMSAAFNERCRWCGGGEHGRSSDCPVRRQQLAFISANGGRSEVLCKYPYLGDCPSSSSHVCHLCGFRGHTARGKRGAGGKVAKVVHAPTVFTRTVVCKNSQPYAMIELRKAELLASRQRK